APGRPGRAGGWCRLEAPGCPRDHHAERNDPRVWPATARPGIPRGAAVGLGQWNHEGRRAHSHQPAATDRSPGQQDDPQRVASAPAVSWCRPWPESVSIPRSRGLGAPDLDGLCAARWLLDTVAEDRMLTRIATALVLVAGCSVGDMGGKNPGGPDA